MLECNLSDILLISCFFSLQLVDALGRLIYQSLDYGFHAEEERELSHPLETLIDAMTISEETEDETDGNNDGDDEGIEDGNCSDEDNNNDGKITNFEQVLQVRFDDTFKFKGFLFDPQNSPYPPKKN